MKKKNLVTVLLGAALLASPTIAGENGADVVLTTSSKGELGPYLADQGGRALYLIEHAPKNQSSCYGKCADVWPPLIVGESGVEALGKVDESLIGTIERRDGKSQVTYNGHALYYYIKDKGDKRASGQDYTDKWGEWYLVTPDGKPLEEHGGESHASVQKSAIR